MKKLALITLLLSLSLVAGTFTHSVDIDGGITGAPGVDSTENSLSIQGNYDAKAQFENGLYIPFEASVQNYTLPPLDERQGTPVEKYTTPNYLQGYTGIGWRGIFDIALRGYGKTCWNNQILAMPWSPSTSPEYLFGGFTENYHAGFDVNLLLPFDRFTMQVYSLNLFANQSYTNDEVFPSINNSNTFDHDWWLQSSAQIHIIKDKLQIVGSLLHKNDLATSNSYDLTFASFGIGTDLKIGRKWHLWGDVSSRVYDNQRMSERGYLSDEGWTQNIGLLCQARTVVALKKQLYLKGDMQLDLSSLMLKSRFDLSMKKVWKKKDISSQVGYWTTPGSLFPRQCAYYSGSFGIGELVDILPEAKAYWQWNNNTSSYNYSHTDLQLELTVKLPKEDVPAFKRFAFMGGVDYKIFSDQTLFFSTQLSGYLGIRTYL